MKKLLIAFVLLLTAAGASAQTSEARPTANINSVVVDSAGMRYAYVVWQRLVQSGEYWLKPVDYKKENTPFIIINRYIRLSRTII
jgi:hypothetical protein